MESLTDLFKDNILPSHEDFIHAQPIPMVVVDNFLPNDVALAMYNEIHSINDTNWKEFTRKGSHMIELNKLDMTPVAFEVMSYFHSAGALNQLTKLTGIKGLIPDPHMVGSGYSKSFRGDTLQVHNDFNWNDTLKLHRALSLIVYLTPGWESSWHGGLDFYDKEREHVVKHVDCLFNRCIIWKYDKLGWHGHTTPLACPEDKPRTTFRIFYYTSNSSYLEDDPPHRSQYWYDPITKKAYDKREEK